MKRHICITTVGFGFGGAERLILDITGGIKDFKFTVVGLKEGGPLKERLKKMGIDVYSLNGRFTFDTRVIFRYLSLIKKLKPDLINTHLIKANWLGRISGKILNIPVVSTIHNTYSFMNPVEKYIERKTAPLSINVACSKGVMELNNKIIGRFYSRYINNGVELPELKRHGNKERLLTISRLDLKQKRIDILIKAFKKLLYDFPYASLTIVGDGKDKRTLVELTKKLNLQGSVHFTGFIDITPDFLQKFGTFVLISEFEGLPYSALESMASGLITVASSTGGLMDLIKDRETGFIIRENSPNTVYNTLKMVMKEKYRDNIRHNARNHIKTYFSKDNTLKNWKRVFYEALD